MNFSRKLISIVITLVMLASLSSCASFNAWGESLNQAFKGVPATLSTFNADGVLIDRIDGKSFRITRDERFDSTDSEGFSNKDSSVLMVSLGDDHISHVGSTLILAHESLENIMNTDNSRVSIENTEPGTPWLNDFVERYRNMISGKSKVIMIRSQLGTPIAVYFGNNVEILSTDVPKSTWFQVDGKYLFVYRADYTVVDADLLKGS